MVNQPKYTRSCILILVNVGVILCVTKNTGKIIGSHHSDKTGALHLVEKLGDSVERQSSLEFDLRNIQDQFASASAEPAGLKSQPKHASSGGISKRKSLHELEQELAFLNAGEVAQWREALERGIEGNKDLGNLSRELSSRRFQQCPFVFLDLGSNSGDSLWKFISSDLPSSRHGHLRVNSEDSTHISIAPADKRNFWVLPKYVRDHMAEGTKPEDYCYFGVEGNPRFTQRLQQIEITVMTMRPRPVRFVHFFTNHIGTKEDGPTTLFLDTTNKDYNFAGSSIYSSKSHVNASSPVNVTGISLPTLLSQTLKPYNGRGHVIIKIDIEGAEYLLLEGAVEANVFCELRALNVSTHILLEPHGDEKLGTSVPRERWESQIEGPRKLKECGVDLLVADAGRRI